MSLRINSSRGGQGLAAATSRAAIPVAAPDLGGNEEAYVVEAIRSSWISSTGPFVQRFENEFAKLCGTRTSMGVCNGTVALHLALLGLDVRPGDEVLVPSLTYIATANAVRYVGAEPVFVDVDPATWCIDPKLLEASITRRTKGIIAVHLYGHPADMDAINHLAAVQGLWVVEDAAEAHMALYKGRVVGGLSQIGTFSFYGNKIFTSGEGGALTVNDPSLNYGCARYAVRESIRSDATTFLSPDTTFALQILHARCCAPNWSDARKSWLAAMQSLPATMRCCRGRRASALQPVAEWAEPAPWLYAITVDEDAYGRSRDELMAMLGENQVETRPFFLALHRLPPFREESRRRREELPVTDGLSVTGMNLPTFSALSEGDQERIATVIRSGHR